jgi:hypothetical protein
MYTEGMTRVRRDVQQKFHLSSPQLDALTQWLSPHPAPRLSPSSTNTSSTTATTTTTTTTIVTSSTTGTSSPGQQSTGEVKVVEGSVVQALEHSFQPRFICHQANCQSTSSRGLSSSLFRQFPGCNIYKGRVRRNPATHDQPGTIKVTGPLIHMFGQKTPGKGNQREKKQRPIWFQQCLDHMERLPQLAAQADGSRPWIAMPFGIACGLAGGDWNGVYFPMLKQWAQKTGIRLLLFQYTP